MNPIRPRAAILALVFGLLAPAAGRAQDVGLDLGTTPAPVTIEDLDGNPVDLARWVGSKPVILEFWATWCPLCAALEPRLAAAKSRYGDRLDVVFIAVAVNQSQRSIRRHLDRHPMPGPILWDAGGRAVRAFMAPSTSYVVILDAEGKVRYTGVGEDQDISAALTKLMK